VGSSPHLTEELSVADLILAIDPGQYKSAACLYDPATAEAAFRTTQDLIEGPYRLGMGGPISEKGALAPGSYGTI
jgi:hypothetical protein